jgi:acyl-CoA synthetase (AMP-forming)/AMP-acid ligase II
MQLLQIFKVTGTDAHHCALPKEGEIAVMKYSREQKCILMEKDPTLRGFFDILCADGSAPAMYWLEDGQERSLSFEEFAGEALLCGGRVEALSCGKRGGWVGIAADTCRQWPVIYWGLVSAGRRPLLLDAALDAPKLNALLREAGANTLVTDRTRRAGRGAVPHGGASRRLCRPLRRRMGRHHGGVHLRHHQIPACSYTTAGPCACRRRPSSASRWAKTITAEERGPLRTLCFLPMNHIFGFMTNLVWTWMLGYPQVFLRDRAPETIFATCQALGCSTPPPCRCS